MEIQSLDGLAERLLQRAGARRLGTAGQDELLSLCWRMNQRCTASMQGKEKPSVPTCGQQRSVTEHRALMGGLDTLELVIQRSGPETEALPTSHNCFNYLLLPEYSDDAKLRGKLLTAINSAEGFGLQ